MSRNFGSPLGNSITAALTGLLVMVSAIGCSDTTGNGAAAAVSDLDAESVSAVIAPESTPAVTPTEATQPGVTEQGTADQGTSDSGSPKLRVGTFQDKPGVGYLAPGDDTPSGFDVDVAAYVAWKLGYSPYDIEWVESPVAFREILLDSGQVDMVVAAYWWSQERAEVVDFAGPYLVLSQDLLVRSDDMEITGPADLLGKTVCSVGGSIPMVRIRAMLGAGADYLEEALLPECVRRLVNDEVDAVTADDFILAGLAASDDYFGKVRLVNAPFAQEEYAIGLPKDSPELCEEVNGALQEMFQDGSWSRFINRHTDGTGFTPNPELNPPKNMLACR